MAQLAGAQSRMGGWESEDLEGTSASGLCSQESLGAGGDMTTEMQSCWGQQLEGTVAKLQLSFHYQ